MEGKEIARVTFAGIGSVIATIGLVEMFSGVFSNYMKMKINIKSAKYEAKYNGKEKDKEIERLNQLIRDISKDK